MRDFVKMPTVDGVKLRKCPFCGSAAPKLYNVHGLFMVGCPACCGCSGIEHTKEKAVKYWNMRNGKAWRGGSNETD